MYTKPGPTKLVLFLFFLTHAVVYAQQQTADSLKKVLGFSNDTARVELLLKLTDAYMKFSPSKALDPATEAQYLSFQLSNERLEAKSLHAVGKVNFKTGNFNEAISAYEQSRQLF